jgi:hypothetical protein
LGLLVLVRELVLELELVQGQALRSVGYSLGQV